VLTEYNTEATVAFIDPYQENRRQIRGSHASFSGDGNHFAVRTLSMDSVSIFTFPDLREIKKVELPARMSEMQMSADGKMIFVSDFERPNIYQVDVDTGNVIHTFSIESHQRDEVNTIAISPDGTKLVASVSEIMGKESDITIWNLSDKTIIKSWHFAGWSLRPMSMTFSPDGNLLAIGTNNYVIVLDVSN
jgi:WD40 repeat protein